MRPQSKAALRDVFYSPVMVGSKRHSGNVFPFRYSEALLRNVMESAAVGMVLIGTTGRLIYANRAFGEMLGYDPSEVIGFRAGRDSCTRTISLTHTPR